VSSLISAAEIVPALLTVSGMAYSLIALWGARDFVRSMARRSPQPFTPGVSVLKPLKGADPRMFAGFASHCEQQYGGEWELLFGVSSLHDSAVAEVARLRVEFPEAKIELIECAQRLGTNGKVSTLAQLLPHARHEHIIVNDSDILVSPQYFARVAAPFADPKVGLVTMLYIGRASGGLWSRLEALGIAADFIPGVLTARKLEGGVRFGLGSTLATTKTAIAQIGGFESLVDQLADDYEMGVRLTKAGYRVELGAEVVATSVPRYTLRGFSDHQLRWSRSTRDSRKAGYFGLCVTYVLPWALLTVIASGGALWSFSLFSLALMVRIALALTVGVGILRDEQVLRDLWLLPLRDVFGLFFWVWSYASDVVVWRGERFYLKNGVLKRI
jgi:ceramide glucosyltransferase